MGVGVGMWVSVCVVCVYVSVCVCVCMCIYNVYIYIHLYCRNCYRHSLSTFPNLLHLYSKITIASIVTMCRNDLYLHIQTIYITLG